MFDTIINIDGKIRQRTSEMLTFCPTDDQAEILLYTNVPWRYIKITKKVVIYRGENTTLKNGIEYRNVEEYLKSLV